MTVLPYVYCIWNIMLINDFTVANWRILRMFYSTNFDPSAVPKYHIDCMSWCSVRYLVKWLRSPVMMLTTPPGKSDVSNTCNNYSKINFWSLLQFVDTNIVLIVILYCQEKYMQTISYNYTIDKCFALKFLNFGEEENSGSRQDT
jgi:hypothetical protein